MNKQDVIASIKEQMQNGEYYNELQVEGVDIKEVDSKGGEGQGEEIYYVFKVTPKDGLDYFVKVDGYYESLNGSDFSYCDATEVEQYEKVVKAWRNV